MIVKNTVSRNDSIYEAWPDIVMTDSGKLICVFTECAHHLDRTDARLMLIESTDRGYTWKNKRPLTEKGTKSDNFNCARITRLHDGRLAILCDRVYGDENRSSQIYLWYGDCEGEHWEEPVAYPFCGIVPDKLLELENGRLLIFAHFKSQNSGKLEQYCWYSDDSGKTWSERVTVAAHPEYNLCEASAIVCDGGEIVVFMRENSFKGLPIFKVISYDGGVTWSEIIPTQMNAGHRPTVGYLRDGSVMLTYRYIPGCTHNVFAAFFKKTDLLEIDYSKQATRIMPLDYDRNQSPDLGYTGWVQLDDGEIYVVNYIKDDADKAYIRGYRFSEEDIVLPVTEQATKNVFG